MKRNYSHQPKEKYIKNEKNKNIDLNKDNEMSLSIKKLKNNLQIKNKNNNNNNYIEINKFSTPKAKSNNSSKVNNFKDNKFI